MFYSFWFWLRREKARWLTSSFGVTFFFLYSFHFFFKWSGNTFHSQWTHPSDTVYPVIICFWFIWMPTKLSLLFPVFPLYSTSFHSCYSVSYFLYVRIKVVFNVIHMFQCAIKTQTWVKLQHVLPRSLGLLCTRFTLSMEQSLCNYV